MISDELLEMPFIKHYKFKQDVINVLLDNKNKDGFCSIYQREIANRLNVSQTFISLTIRKLQSFDKAIEVVSKGKYVIVIENIFESDLFKKLLTAYRKIILNPKIIEHPHILKDTAKLLNITVPELQFVSGFIYCNANYYCT